MNPPVYVQEGSPRPPTVDGPTSVTAFLVVGGPAAPVRELDSVSGIDAASGCTGALALALAAYRSAGGERAIVAAAPTVAEGLAALDNTDFNLLVVVSTTPQAEIAPQSWADAAALCEAKLAFLLIDPPAAWRTVEDVVAGEAAVTTSKNAAMYFPRLMVTHAGATHVVGPAATVAGVMARVDASQGVWKAPSGLLASLPDGVALEIPLAVGQTEALNAHSVNAIATVHGMPTPVIWGARLRSSQSDPEWKYVNVRRLVMSIERSIDAGTQWAVFEPNGEQLWARLRAAVEGYLLSLWRDGALQGSRAFEAFFVRCDATTMTADDIRAGRVILELGVAPVRPAEFIVLRMSIASAR